MTDKSPKTTRKSRQNPWYKNQVGSLNGRHARLADKVRALKAYANGTEIALRETQQELAFAMDVVRELTVEVRSLQVIVIGAGKPLMSPKSVNKSK